MNDSIITVREWSNIPDLEHDKIASLLSSCSEYFIPCYKNGRIQAQSKSFVGTVIFNDGTKIDVLPKINSPDYESRELLEKMIRTVIIKPKYFEKTMSGSRKDTLIEYFIRMFCNEAEEVIRKGLSHGYSKKEENLNCIKGRILFHKDIKYNAIDHSKTFVCHNIYSDDTPENRIVAATVKILQKTSCDSENQRLLHKIGSSFIETKISNDYEKDFKKCLHTRGIQHYDSLLNMCKVIIDGSHSVFSGDNISISLLFDMNVLYERYVAHWIKLNYPSARVTRQDKGKKLFNKFELIPDIVMTMNGETIIMDTKWKFLDNGSISRDDAHQMFAYISKYNACKNAYLLYPKMTESNQNRTYVDETGKTLHISFIDVFDEKNIFPIPTS